MSMHPQKHDAGMADFALDPAASFARPGDVLALVTSTDPWSPAAVAGSAIAARWGGNLTGCFIEPSARMLRDSEGEGGPAAPGRLAEPHADDVDAFAAFGSLARQSGVAAATWTTSGVGVAQTLRHLGAWHDLAVIERDMVAQSGLLDVLGEAILGCQLACLILPPRWNREIRFERVVIGCNGSLESIRAIHAAMPFLRMAKQVTLIDGDVRGSRNAYGRLPHFDPFVYLLRHHITARPQYIRASSDLAGDLLLKEARDGQVDLLVMGAYGQSPTRERFFGGATRQVLEGADIPVLMRH
ncbi:universal stress protein [Rhodanobacter umsongensis]|uniref:Universal stress protein n=1 Tax=Rhodanobacter umsongensis TaxID=633153 RepID=A0ABW0JN11_9GAMM